VRRQPSEHAQSGLVSLPFQGRGGKDSDFASEVARNVVQR
jgi:hypothetical protein